MPLKKKKKNKKVLAVNFHGLLLCQHQLPLQFLHLVKLKMT